MLNTLLNRLSLYYLIDYFEQCGVIIVPQQVYTRAVLEERLNIQEKFLPFLNYMLSILHQVGFIKIDRGNIQCLIDAKTLSVADLKAEILEKFPEKKALIHLLNYFAAYYRQALSGEIPAIGVLYPNADIYFLDPVVREMEEASNIVWFERFLKKFLSIRGKKNPFLVMEVGAGAGHFTWTIISHLLAQHTKYFFTDLSRFFVLKAKEIAAKNCVHFMEFATFDITQSLESQGFKKNTIDVLLASNVVHATADLKATLSNLKSLLSPDGLLILIEYTSLPLWLHMIWGFAEGWWYFADEYRKLTPLIKEKDWIHVLSQAGYGKIKIFPKKRDKLIPLSLTGMIAVNCTKQKISHK